MSTQRSMFKSGRGQALYLTAYDTTLALWPVAVESLDVPTRFGGTHVNACGSKDALPLVLLPGVAISSTMWYPNVADLSRSFRLYAIDTIGDAGKSVCTRPPRTRSDFVDWLSDVSNELQLPSAHVAGMSYGGFLALNLALAAPNRLMKLVLLSPAACLQPFAAQFYLRFILGLIAETVISARALRLSLMRWMFAMPIVNGAPVVEQLLLSRHFRGDLHVFPAVYRDDELRQLRVPTLLLLGEGEVIYDPWAAMRRALSLIPDIEAEVIPGARHAISFDMPRVVNARIVRFLEAEAGARKGVTR